MHHADINTSYIQNSEKFENREILQILRAAFIKLVKIRDFLAEFLKFLKFAFSVLGCDDVCLTGDVSWRSRRR